jgi:hypothetical protein
MSAFPLTRHAALAAFGAFIVPATAEIRSASAQAGLRIRAIKVDVLPIRASFGNPTAAWVEEALPGALAPYMAPAIATARPWWRGSTISISDKAVAGPASSTRLKTPSTERSWLKDREAASSPMCRCGRSPPISRWRSIRPWSSAPEGRVTTLAQVFAGWASRELGL